LFELRLILSGINYASYDIDDDDDGGDDEEAFLRPDATSWLYPT
jgi:hypothetical protein